MTPEPPDFDSHQRAMRHARILAGDDAEPQPRVELTLTMPAAVWDAVRDKLDALCAEYGIESRVREIEPEERT